MTKLTLTNHAQANTVVLENEVIDKYLAKANGEYVKVYLVLLRHLNDPDGPLSISQIADLLDYTEKDVIRALNYWKKQGLLDYETKTEGETPVEAVETPVPAVPLGQNVKSIQDFKNRKEFKEILLVAEAYLGKTLSVTDVEILSYFYQSLQMSADLIEYLIEYCVEMGHKSMHYIQKVALSWHEKGVETPAEARQAALMYNKDYYTVLNAYGIRGRGPVTSEATYIKKWFEEYGFSTELVVEACNRTMNAIHQASFDYTDSILKNWFDHQVRTIKDVAALDASYMKEKEAGKKKQKAVVQPTKFNNFQGRTSDVSELERKLIQQ